MVHRFYRRATRTCIVGLTLLSIAALSPAAAHAQYAFFDGTTDSIQLAGTSTLGTTATFEAVLRPLTATSGIVYNEWRNAGMDKQLIAGDTLVSGFAYTGSTPLSSLPFNTALSTDAFTHVAFVRDNTIERLFINGVEVASRSVANNDIQDGIGGDGAIARALGAVFRDGFINSSFQGYMDSIRISTNARYSANFLAPTGDMTSDANTNLLYNFNLNEFNNGIIADLSGNGRDGTFGATFAGATSPAIVSLSATNAPEPTSALLVLLGGMTVTALRRHR